MRWYDGTGWCYDAVLAVNFHLLLLPFKSIFSWDYAWYNYIIFACFKWICEFYNFVGYFVWTSIAWKVIGTNNNYLCRLFFLRVFYIIFHILNFCPWEMLYHMFLMLYWFRDSTIINVFYNWVSKDNFGALVLVFEMIDFRGCESVLLVWFFFIIICCYS